MKILCSNCNNEVNMMDDICPSCKNHLEAFDFENISDGALKLENIREEGKEVVVDINGRKYSYIVPKQLPKGSGELANKRPTPSEVVEHIKSFLEKSQSPGKVVQWIKNNLILSTGSKKGAGVNDELSDEQYDEISEQIFQDFELEENEGTWEKEYEIEGITEDEIEDLTSYVDSYLTEALNEWFGDEDMGLEVVSVFSKIELTDEGLAKVSIEYSFSEVE